MVRALWIILIIFLTEKSALPTTGYSGDGGEWIPARLHTGKTSKGDEPGPDLGTRGRPCFWFSRLLSNRSTMLSNCSAAPHGCEASKLPRSSNCLPTLANCLPMFSCPSNRLPTARCSSIARLCSPAPPTACQLLANGLNSQLLACTNVV